VLLAAFVAMGAAPDPAATPAPVMGTHAQHGPRVPVKESANDFSVVAWLSLTPAADSLIRSPSQQAGVDLTTRDDDDNNITVYARKKRPDVGPHPVTGYAPIDNGAAVPANVRYLPPEHCANAAYNTVAGQSASDQDLIGFLGSGDGC
jgi:hypothetical protein